MIHTEEGKFIIEIIEIDNFVHEHFWNIFQTTRDELKKLPIIKLDDTTHEITQHNKDSNSHRITQTETNKAVLKLKDNSSLGPDGVTGWFAEYLHNKFPKLFNKVHRHFYENKLTWFNQRELIIIKNQEKTITYELIHKPDIHNS